MVIYDFDLTLTVKHADLTYLKKKNLTKLKLEEQKQKMINENYETWFGSSERVKEIQKHFEKLYNMGVQVIDNIRFPLSRFLKNTRF